MKRIVRMVLGGVAVPLLLSGCSGFYNPIPKDTVMVKQLEAYEEFKVKDDALLSEETIKILSLNAVGKYFDHPMDLANVNIEMYYMDNDELKMLLANKTSYLNLDREILDVYVSQLNKISHGLYFAQITNVFNEYDFYVITINPINGDILGASNVDYPDVKMNDKRLTDEELIQQVKQFIEQKQIVEDQIDYSKITVHHRTNGFSEMFYMSEDGLVIFRVAINRNTNKVLDFSKDILAAIHMAANNND